MVAANDSVTIRAFRAEDAVAAAQIFFDAVHEGTKDHYSAAQRRAWGGAVPDPARWLARLSATTAFVAAQDGAVLGFMTIDADGLINFAFVSPAVAGAGVGWRLYRAVEEKARQLGVTRLHTEASLKAKPFFERQGLRVLQEQKVPVKGLKLTNFKMQKAL